MKKADHTCTKCDKPGATERHDDAGDNVHWWHPLCWREFRMWLSGHDGPSNKKCKNPLCLLCPKKKRK